MLNETSCLEMQAMRTSVEPTYRDAAREMREMQKSILEHAKERSEEAWKPIKGTRRKYWVSNWGRVRRGGKYLLGFLNRKHLGYCLLELRVRKARKFVLLHRLVADAFLDKRPSKMHGINHVDCNRFNNCVWNLEWATQEENMDHASRNGRLNAPTIYSAETVDSMCASYQAGESVNAICARYDCGFGTLYDGLRCRGISLRSRNNAAEAEAEMVARGRHT